MDFFTDFVSEFEEVSICTMGPDFDKDGQVDNALSTLTHHGAWIPGKNAGGCRNDFALFAANPKIKITVKHPTNQVLLLLKAIY
jgi:calpain